MSESAAEYENEDRSTAQHETFGNERLRSLLREVSAQRWECATEYGRCPDCDATFSEPHDSECLLGQIDAELEE